MIWTLLKVTPAVGEQPALQAGEADCRRTGMCCQDWGSEVGTLSSTDLQHESPCAQQMPDWLQTHHSLSSSREQCLAESLPSASDFLINSHIENPDFNPCHSSLFHLFLFLFIVRLESLSTCTFCFLTSDSH